MKLIIEHWHGETYVYTEGNEHHKRVEHKRKTPLVNYNDAFEKLDSDCNIATNKYLPEDWHMVFNIQKKRNKKTDGRKNK